MKAANKQETTSYDRMISVLAVVLLLILFFAHQSRLSVTLSALIVFLVALNPITHLDGILESKIRQRLATGALLVLVVWWAGSNWPTEKPPHSDLRIEMTQFRKPFKANEPPHVHVQVANDSPYTIQTFSVGLMKTLDGVPDETSEREAERQLWRELEAKVEEIRKQMTPEEFYGAGTAILPRVPSVVPLEVSVNLTEAQAASLQSENGGAILFAMSVYLYRGDTGEYGIASCIYTQGGTNRLPNRCRTGHNGPIKFKPDHWWNLSE